MAFIYCIENTINSKKYVGETCYSIETRWQEHKRMAKREIAEKRPLYSAINKYSEENFIIYQLEECDYNKRFEREVYWIEKLNTYKNGYNATIGGNGSPTIQWNKEKFLEMVENKNSPQEIADYFDCCIDSVSKYAKTIGISFRGWKTRNHINMINEKGEVCKTFYSAGEAARWLIQAGYSLAQEASISINIMRCCKGIRDSAYGFKWKFR